MLAIGWHVPPGVPIISTRLDHHAQAGYDGRNECRLLFPYLDGRSAASKCQGDLAMSTSLADVLRQVELEPGRVYRCQVGDLRVEVRVEKPVPDPAPAPLRESDVMLDPWTDLPTPQPITLLQAKPERLLLPDPPDLPIDWKDGSPHEDASLHRNHDP